MPSPERVTTYIVIVGNRSFGPFQTPEEARLFALCEKGIYYYLRDPETIAECDADDRAARAWLAATERIKQ